jgi:RND family efflux transporter MFP subunit
MKRRFYALIPIIILLALIGWRVNQRHGELIAKAEATSRRMHAAPVVNIATVETRDIAQTFEATGSVAAPLNVNIAPKITGRITFLQVHEGDRVHKGQVLVRIDPSDVLAQMRQAEAGVAEAQYKLAQAKLTQNPTNVSVNTQIRQQKAGANSAKANYNQTYQNYQAQISAANANVSDTQGRVAVADAAISSAKANLNDATTKCNRITDLYKQGFTAAQDVDDAKAAVEVAQSQLQSAQAQRSSAIAQKKSAEENLSIVKTKGSADIEAAHASLLQAEAGLEYATSNTAQKAAYQQSIAALQAEVSAAKQNLESAKSHLSDTVLVSPMDGYVTGRMQDPGAVSTAGQPIITVQFMKQVWVTISVPQDIANKVHIGQKASIKLDPIPGETFTGSIIQANPAADSMSREFMVRVILSNPQNLLKPGMFAHVALETDRLHNATAVPREAIQQQGTDTFVVVVGDDNKAAHRPVTVGPQDATYMAVLQGLTPGEKVVTMSAVPLKDGTKVALPGQKPDSGMRGQGGKQGSTFSR